MWQPKLRPVLLRRQFMIAHEVPLEHLEALAASKAHQMIGKDRLLHLDSGFSRRRLGGSFANRRERPMHVPDQRW